MGAFLLAGVVLAPKPFTMAAMEIKSVCFLPKNHAIASFIPTIVERVNAACGGEIVWNHIGGPEVIPGRDQFNAVKTGVVTASFLVAAYYASDVPGAFSTALSKLDPWEERKSGYYDLINDLHKKNNTYYLGRWHKMGFYIWTNSGFKNLSDLRGRKIRASGTLLPPWINGLGMRSVEIPPPDVYTGLQRGLVDGVGWPTIGICDMGWCSVIKYCADHESLSASNALSIINLDTWNKIPSHLQEKIEKVFADSEHDMVAHFNKIISQEMQKAKNKGIQFIKLSDEEGARVREIGYQKGWEYQKKIAPDLYEKIRKSLKLP
jgi:TRAP-type C4-dicarboxylate transport system substrate-binding protein